MTTAQMIIAEVDECGGQVLIDGADLIVRRIPRRLVNAIREHKPQIIALLRERQPVPCASDAVAEAARLLREHRWKLEPAPCAFHVGAPGETCRRCGGHWVEHFPNATAEGGSSSPRAPR